MKLKMIVLTMCLIIMAAYNAHAQTQTGYRIPPRADVGGGRMTGDMWCQYGTNGVRFKIGTQTVTQVGTAGVINGTNATSLPSLDFTYVGGSMSANFNGFNAVYVAGSQVGTSGALTGKLDAVGGVGTNNTFNNPTLAGLGTITASFGANGLVITPAEYASVNNATGELQAQITTATGSITNHTHTGSDGTTQVSHTNLTNKGTQTHTQIDDFIASKAVASGVASLDANSLVVQNPASGTSTPGVSKIVMSDGTGKILDGWLSNNVTKLGTPTTSNIPEGSNLYHTDSRVNAAVGSLSVNTLNDVNIAFNENDFVKIVGGQLVAGSSSSSVAWSGIDTGTPTDNAFFSTTLAANKIPFVATGNLNGWINNTVTVSTIQATSTSNTFGTTTQWNGSVVTIHGTASTSPLSVICPVVMVAGTGTTSLMTSNTAPSPSIVTASSIYSGSYDSFQAFDRNYVHPYRWISGAGQASNVWITYNYGTGNSHVLHSYKVAAAANSENDLAPNTFTLNGSNDNITWTCIDRQSGITGWTQGVSKVYTIATSTTAYQFYKLYIEVNNGGAQTEVAELQLIKGETNNPTSFYINGSGTVMVNTTDPNSTSTSYIFQVSGSGLATSWGVTCYEAIKSIIGSGTDVIEEGYNAVMGTKLFKHHPKIRNDITLAQAEEVAKTEYVKSFEEADYETFKASNLSKYLADKGTDTANWKRLRKDFETESVGLRKDEFYVLTDKEERVRQKKVELESDTSITSITPVSDDPSTPDLFKRGDKRILDLQPQIGALMGTVQYQDVQIKAMQLEIKELKLLLDK